MYTSSMNKTLMIIIALVVVGGIGYGVYSYTNNSQPTTSSSPSSSDGSSDSDKVITAEELAKNNGKDGANCWVAVEGKVYDATGSSSFKNGVHVQSKGQTTCGNDETDSIGKSPHGSEVLSKLTVVGTLSN